MDSEYIIRKAYESILESDFERATDWFERAVLLEPDNAEYHYKLSITYARSNRLAKALEHVEAAKRLEPDNETYRQHGAVLYARHLVSEAEKRLADGERPDWSVVALRQAIESDPLCLQAYLLLAEAYGRLGDFPLALQAAKDAIKLDPQHEEAKRLVRYYSEALKHYLRSSR